MPTWNALMLAGHFDAAWQLSDRALLARDKLTRDDPGVPYHQRWVWSGLPPDDRHVTVRCYHGLGDTLQFMRFLPQLRARAASVTLEAQAELCPLLQSVAGVDKLVSFDPARPLPPSQCDMEIMELGHVLRATPSGAAYLTLPAHRAARGQQRAGGRVALCWQAGDWDASRSVKLQLMIDVLAAPGRRFISLQRGAAAGQALPELFDNPCDTDCDVIETAALIAGAAHVVTVDTMVAHLAGALGCAATLLLKPDADWRWAVSGRKSVWYSSLRVLSFAAFSEVRGGLF